MLKDIVDVKPLEGHRLRVRFEDGIEGEIDVASLVSFRGVFEPLKDPAFSGGSAWTLILARSFGPTAPTWIRMCSTRA